MITKTNNSNESEVREKVLEGVKKMSDLVGLTLGPSGRSILIERGAGEPLIIDDGRRAAENMKLEDPIEHLATRVAYQVTRKTDEKVGDGTTTSMVLTHAILKDVHENEIGSGAGISFNVSEIDKRIKADKDVVIKELDKIAKQIKTEKDLINVATVAVGDDKLGEIIGKMYWELGKDGHIALEFNFLSEEIDTEIVKGYRFSGGYAANWMLTDVMRKTCELKEINTLVTNTKLTDFSTEVAPVINMLANNGKRGLLIIAPKFSDDILRNVFSVATRKTQPFIVVCVRAPGRGEEAYKDMAIFTGGKLFLEKEGVVNVMMEDLGYVGKADITEDTCILMEGKGKDEALKKRIKEVEAEAKNEHLPQFKQDRLERMSALSGGVGLIKIGAPTDEERNWLKHKIEDAKYATKQAFQGGIVKGGGLTLKEISEKLPDTNILKRAILAPYERLRENAGGDFKVGKDVFDPVAVEKTAIENATSAVSKLIRIGGAIAFNHPPKIEDALKGLFSQIGPSEDNEQ